MKKGFLLLLLFVIAYVVSAQTPINMGGSINVVRGCDFIIYDNGGSGSGYGSNRNDKLTIYSSDPAQTNVSVIVEVSAFNVHPSDTFYIIYC